MCWFCELDSFESHSQKFFWNESEFVLQSKKMWFVHISKMKKKYAVEKKTLNSRRHFMVIFCVLFAFIST